MGIISYKTILHRKSAFLVYFIIRCTHALTFLVQSLFIISFLCIYCESWFSIKFLSIIYFLSNEDESVSTPATLHDDDNPDDEEILPKKHRGMVDVDAVASPGDNDNSNNPPSEKNMGETGSISGDKHQWPAMQDLNTRLRRVITSYQRNYKKEELKLQHQQQMQQKSKVF